MKVPQYITIYRAVTVAVTLVIMFAFLLGDVVGLLAVLLKGI
jgi:vacuolar-type H+-ATPase subunit I/STV1